MTSNIITNGMTYKALTITSGMMLGDDSKDQDRAGWFQPGQIACVCDGVSASPNSDQAAETVVSLMPALFQGDTNQRLAMVCDLLMAKRQQSCREEQKINLPKNASTSMQDMLREVVKQKRRFSFQTTLIAIRIIADRQTTIADIIKCGDSAFFAFSPDGQLLTSSLAFPQNAASTSLKQETSEENKEILFGPGDEILVRLETQLQPHSQLAKQAGIKPRHAANWLVCTPIDGCRYKDETPTENLSDLQKIILHSSTIRPVFAHKTITCIDDFADNGAATMVLPDHYYTGAFDCFQDCFPARTHFVLGSDGFYGSFPHAQAMWSWLQRNAAGLQDEEKSKSIMQQLHHTLHDRGGDDDISFVWAFPCPTCA